MANNQLYIIFIAKKSEVSAEDLKKKFDLAIDWFRLNQNCWIVYTSSDASKWYNRLESLVRPDGSVFISKLDISDNTGWMTEAFWDWLKKRKESNI